MTTSIIRFTPTPLATARKVGLFGSNAYFIGLQDSREGEFARSHGIVTGDAMVQGHASAIIPQSANGIFALPEKFYLSCDSRKTMAYYRRFAFIPVGGLVSPDGSRLMKIDRQAIRGWFSKELKNRPGRLILPEVTLQYQQIARLSSIHRSGGDFERFRKLYAEFVVLPEVTSCTELLSYRPIVLDPDL